ncbi:nucleoside-diphosphate kinase [Candidatus Cytomitobacter indipagum]|uniref:Nucleoside diphosphate kinase n=2 Tax=Candidatus Cytomitobacter indipagum TaxID=2601575 RepID=A0A5C0UEZ4_9PROT|nr:nucleoside-diphosphate kinase [Candidatus Cytomitobacter indipagum]QEK38213.1 nucleoside-diphosphate kinase [Candidatus Cytomitobacter indipagum]
MMILKTLSIIKPDAVKKGVSGNIISMFESNGFNIVAMKKIHLSKKQAEEFYKEHSARPFYGDLCDFMCSGPVIVQVLERENSIKANRDLMGATNPSESDNGTIRKMYGDSIDNNAVHGSDSEESANREISFFFSDLEIC